MKIDFNMPSALPRDGLVSYSVKNMWRLDNGKLISESLTLKVDFSGDEYTLENIYPIFKAIQEANPDVFESALNMPAELQPTFIMIFCKWGKSAEQDPDDCENIHYPPQDPMEWRQTG